jgi:Flp pilus assembly protein TadD
VVEKIPLLLLSLVSSAVTLIVQRGGGAMVAGAEIPLLTGAIPNALVSYAGYLGKAFWPAQLSVLYPHPSIPGSGGVPLEAWQIGAALALLLGISAAVVASRRRYALVGWLWYLGTLVPVIGLIQVGNQAMADRYTYLPLVGLSIAVAWGVAELARRLGGNSQRVESALTALALAVLLPLLLVSRAQTAHWRNSEALFTRALEVTPRNSIAHNNLGNALHARGRNEEAVAHYRSAVEVDPRFASAHRNLANVLLVQENLEEALRHYRRAAELNPGSFRTHVQIARTLFLQGRSEEAARHYRRALEIAPDSGGAHVELASVLVALGEFDEGIRHCRRAVEIDPDDETARSALREALKRRDDARGE